jgi:hypothetical protein
MSGERLKLYINKRFEILAVTVYERKREHISSRGALCQYLADEGPAREAKMCLTAYVSL